LLFFTLFFAFYIQIATLSLNNISL